MVAQGPPGLPNESKITMQRGNFYFGLGFALVAGLLLVLGLGFLDLSSPGILSLSTAFVMTGVAITLIAAATVVTLFTLRRTLHVLARHDARMQAQEARHHFLERRVRARWMEDQVRRDKRQDQQIAVLSARPQAEPEAPAHEEEPVQPVATMRAVQDTPPPSTADPFRDGQVHPVRDIEGIGETYGRGLNNMGVRDTRDLWYADPRTVARAVHVDAAEVKRWQSMAELMAVTGIGKQYAELLALAGVRSIPQLAESDPERLLRRIQLEQDQSEVRAQGNHIGLKHVLSWIHAAQWHADLVSAMNA